MVINSDNVKQKNPLLQKKRHVIQHVLKHQRPPVWAAFAWLFMVPITECTLASSLFVCRFR